jgi:ABC-2 type transport system permease protein
VTGTARLLRFFLRRDRWWLLWWGLGTMVLYVSQAVSVDEIYTTQAEFDRAAASAEGNAAFVAMLGPARALNTTGGQVAWQSTAFGAILAGLMSMFLVGRHTRAEEESGRDELLRAAAVGRRAPMAAALLVALIANVVLGAWVAVGLIAYPLAVADSIALGVGIALCGWAFSGTALLAAQLTTSTRAMYGLAGSAIGIAYALRAIGDVGDSALSWLSPIGWYQAMHAFSGLRWWPAVLLVGATVLAVGAAALVFARRDFGSGVWASRPGRERARPGLVSGPGLAWRLQRGSLLGWALGLLFLGIAYGSMGSDVEDLIGDSETSRELIAQAGGDLLQSFHATAIVTLALIACGFAIASALRPRAEEDEGRVEALLATALPRRTWLLGHVAVTGIGTLLVVLAGGIGLAAAYALTSGESAGTAALVLGTAAQIAPVLTLAGLTRLFYGFSPRAASLAWAALGFCFVMVMFGEVLRIPGWIQDLSPFEHLALVPAEDFRWQPFVVLLGVAGVLSAAGQLAFARRDVH